MLILVRLKKHTQANDMKSRFDINIKNTFTKFDSLARECGCFTSFDDLVNRNPNYRPSLKCSNKSKAKVEIEQTIKNNRLAEAYDLYMELIGDERRAYRF